MRFFKNSFVFFLIFAFLSMVGCKGESASKKRLSGGNTVKSSKSAIKVAKEFVKAGMNGDFKKLAGLCCKDSGPYTAFENVRYLDLGDLGHIEKIVREEKSEVDPDNLKLAVARMNVLGQIGFYCFYVFKTPAGYKVYLKRDYLWEYPPSKKFLLETAVGFYLTNKLNLKKAAELAEDLVRLKPNDVQAHFHLASLYKLNNREKEMISELKKVIIMAPNSLYADAMTEDYKIAICEELLKDKDRKLKLKAINYLSKQEGISERNKISLLEIVLQDRDIILRENVVVFLGKIEDDRKIPLLEKVLQDDSIVIKERVARILAGLGNSKGKEVLVNILLDRLRSLIKMGSQKVTGDRKLWKRFSRIIHELGDLGDGRAVPVLIEAFICDPRGFPRVNIKKQLLRIKEPAIPYLEKIISRESEYKKIWRNKGWTDQEIVWVFKNWVKTGLRDILEELKKQ